METEFLTKEEVCYELIKSCGHLLQVSRDESLFKDISVHGFDEDNLWIGAYEQEEAPLNELFWSLSVTFLHQSAKDYFGKRNNDSLGERDRHPLDKLHGSAATQLIQYFRDISRHPLTDRCQFYELTMELPLTLYATRSWHLDLREVQHDEEILLRNQRFFMDVSEPRRAYGAFVRSIDWKFRSKFVREDLAPLILNLACFLGLQDLSKFCMTWACHREADFVWEYTVDPPLHFAIRENNESIINILLDDDTDIVAAGSLAGNAFSLAIQYRSSIDILRRMSRKYQCRRWIMQEAVNPQTILLGVAVGARNIGACRLLINEFKWNVNIPRDNEPIYKAIKWGAFDLVQIFLSEWHAHLDSWKALKATCDQRIRGFKQHLRSLPQDFPIDINAKHEHGYNACVMVLQSSCTPASRLQTLIELGCNPNQPDDEGRTPLHHSAIGRMLFDRPKDFDQILGLLLSQKYAHVDRVCRKGWTVLHHFANSLKGLLDQHMNMNPCQAPQSLRYLLDKGIDRRNEDLDGVSALQILETCLSQDHHHIKESEWMKYVEMAKDMIVMVQDYCTVPDQPRVKVYEE